MTVSSNEKPQYRSRIKEVTLDAEQPKAHMPQRVDVEPWVGDDNTKTGLSLSLSVLLLAVICFVGFSAFDAVDTLVSQFDNYPITTSILGALLFALVACVVTLIGKEVRGLFAVKRYMTHKLDYQALHECADKKSAQKQLAEHAKTFHRDSYAARAYLQYSHALNADLTQQEIISLYQTMVEKPVKDKANQVLKKESMVSGSLSFISPNNVIQTLVVIWISVRTIRRLAQVYGIRPGTMGTWRLLKVLAQNIAAQSFLDLATDELTNQISGSLTAKFLENSAEAIAAGALNVRLGKALIQLLESEK